MPQSWLLLPDGRWVSLSPTKDLLIDSAVLAQDLHEIGDDLAQLLNESKQLMAETRRTVSLSRRQRLGLRLVPEP